MNMNVSITPLIKTKGIHLELLEEGGGECKVLGLLIGDCFLNDHYQAHYMLIIFIWKTKPLKCPGGVIHNNKV